jgi:hypothetical protein
MDAGAWRLDDAHRDLAHDLIVGGLDASPDFLIRRKDWRSVGRPPVFSGGRVFADSEQLDDRLAGQSDNRTARQRSAKRLTVGWTLFGRGRWLLAG